MGVEIIAELGVSHQGDIDVALETARGAMAAGADTVKWQCFNGAGLYPEWQLTHDEQRRLRDEVMDHGCRWLASVFSPADVDFIVDELAARRVKIGSGESHRLELYEKPTFVLSSGGMGDRQHGDFSLYCVSGYPVPLDEVGLEQLAHGNYSGFSDHTFPGIGDAAVLAGALIVERHVCPEGYTGPDWQCSDTPARFAGYVSSVRLAERIMSGAKRRPDGLMPCEVPTYEALREQGRKP